MNPNIIDKFHKIWKPVDCEEGWRNPSPTMNLNVTCNVIINLKFWGKGLLLYLFVFFSIAFNCVLVHLYLYLFIARIQINQLPS